ncbi:iron-containing alcohol dehydrogenase family protein [Thermoanaerobacterium thermosulfurigenes]|uniref:iron-containing alcohol dehydrogenase family protein n=1 Tax=Thermoanaerobacterium thermosulfurigenes TaxID=33950 RepID=UPI003EF127A9
MNEIKKEEVIILRKGEPILLGAGRYIQVQNALDFIGKEILRLGKRAYIIGGKTALEISLEKIRKSIEKEGINYKINIFKGFCSMNQINWLSEEARKFDADVIVGVGGGKAIDTAKAVSNLLDKRIITVPTSAATCASYAVLSVLYSDEGNPLNNMYHNHEMDAVIVDTELITKRCPARMLASGIGDAMAKYPEIYYSLFFDQNWEKSILSEIALRIAKQNWDEYMKIGKKAVEDVEKKLITPEVENVICMNIALTGLTSSLASGGKQLAIAHSFYDAICRYFKQQQTEFLHGELVSLGLLIQMKFNGCSEEDIKNYKEFIKSIKLPTSLSDIGLNTDSPNMNLLYNGIIDDLHIVDSELMLNLKDSMIALK